MHANADEVLRNKYAARPEWFLKVSETLGGLYGAVR
jgi:hypothetical protein